MLAEEHRRESEKNLLDQGLVERTVALCLDLFSYSKARKFDHIFFQGRVFLTYS